MYSQCKVTNASESDTSCTNSYKAATTVQKLTALTLADRAAEACCCVCEQSVVGRSDASVVR